MTLSEWLRGLHRRWMLAANFVALGLIMAGVVNALMPKEYESTATAFVVFTSRQITATDVNQGAEFIDSRLASYVLLAKSPLVLQPVISQLSLSTNVQRLADRVQVSSPKGSTVLTFTAEGENPGQAQRIAQSVMDQTRKAVKKLEGDAASGSPVDLVSVDQASAPVRPSIPHRRLDLLIGSALGLTCSAAFVALETVILRERVTESIGRLTYRDAQGHIVTVPVHVTTALNAATNGRASLPAVLIDD